MSVNEWVKKPKINQVLLSFSIPKTPTQVQKELRIKKLKLKPFLEKHLIESLNQKARKGRFYQLTSKAERLLKLPNSKKQSIKDWNLIGWVMASPKQRFVVLQVMDSEKRTSETIRIRTLRPSIKEKSIITILNELISKGLVETEKKPKIRRFFKGQPIYTKKLIRYYWISEKGKEVRKNLESVIGKSFKTFRELDGKF